jgi:hypothetical protein
MERSQVIELVVVDKICRGGVPRPVPLITRIRQPTNPPGSNPAPPFSVELQYPLSVMLVQVPEFGASAMFRTTIASPASTVPDGSGVTVNAPVVELYAVIV